MSKLVYLGLLNLLLIISFSLVGCGSGGGNSSAGDTTVNPVSNTDTHYPGELFPDVNEQDLLNATSNTVIETVAEDAVVTVVPTTGDKVEVTASEVISENTVNGYVLLSDTSGVTASDVGKPLFIDTIFMGIITDVLSQNAALKILLKNAKNVDDIYSEFSIEMQNSSIKQSVQRSISRHQIKGRYDDINKNPIRFSILEKPVTNKRGIVEDEIILRMDIPEGYHVPIKQRGINCSFSEADCSFTTQGDAQTKLDLGKEYSSGGITFSTKNSYIEMGLGAYIRMHYDGNLIQKDVFDFTIANSGYFKSNMQVSISGELKRDWSTDLKLIKDFDIEIVHPYSAVVKTSIAVAPVITFGVSGKLSGSITATSYLERSGEIRFNYDSKTDTHEFSSTLKYTPKSLNKDGIEVSVKAEAHAYIFPTVLMIPNVKFLRINIPLTLVYFRSGVKLDNAVTGTITSGFVVENGVEQESLGTEASVVTSLYGSVQGRWMVRVGGVDFYHTDEYADIMKTGVMNVLEWNAKLLNQPQIIVKEDSQNKSIKKVTFSANESDKIKEKLYFYYTIANENKAQYDISIAGIESQNHTSLPGFENHTQVWKIGDAPITVSGNKILKVRSVLYNKDISDSIWSWGTSVSQQTSAEIVNMMEPVITPSSTAFKESIVVSISQAQGYDIYYRINGGAPILYSGGVTLSATSSLTAYASAMVDGVKVLSKDTTATYTKCGEGEVVVGGTCEAYEAPIMSTPTATPMEPEFTDSVTVSLITPDGGYIFYKVDDGDWIEYTGPITLTESATIYAYADSDPLDMDAIYSEVVAFSYSKVDNNSGDDVETGTGGDSGTFPESAFNGLQISYSINGLKLGTPSISESFTVSKSYPILAKPSGGVSISGSSAPFDAECNTDYGSFWSQTKVTLRVGSATKEFTSPSPCDKDTNDKYSVSQPSYSFDLSIGAAEGDNSSASFSIEQIYVNPRFGNRAVVINGSE